MRRKSSFLFHIFFGVLFTLIAVFALLAQAGKEYYFPVSMFSATFLELMLLLLGIFYIYEGVRYKESGYRSVHIFVGLALLALSVFPIFQSVGIFKLLPVYIDFSVSILLLSVLLFFSGLFFLLDRFFLLVSQ